MEILKSLGSVNNKATNVCVQYFSSFLYLRAILFKKRNIIKRINFRCQSSTFDLALYLMEDVQTLNIETFLIFKVSL